MRYTTGYFFSGLSNGHERLDVSNEASGRLMEMRYVRLVILDFIKRVWLARMVVGLGDKGFSF